MKVIDLLNKIANGEEVPERIKFLNRTFEFNKDNLKYKNIEKGKNDLLEYLDFYKCIALNKEVEILEDTPKEDKKIEKLDLIFEDKFIKEHFESGSISYLDTYSTLQMLYEKQCEIIDKINGE
jgi:hypothetical protein